MKNELTVLLLSALWATPVWANLDLAKKNACMSCHSAERKLVGPAYQDVAKKYAGQKDAAATLAKNIKAGYGWKKKRLK